jgi:hypothetical protein
MNKNQIISGLSTRKQSYESKKRCTTVCIRLWKFVVKVYQYIHRFFRFFVAFKTTISSI